MVARKGDLVAGDGQAPPLGVFLRQSGPCSRTNDEKRAAHQHSQLHPSILIDSMIFESIACLAGSKLARAATGKSHIGVRRSCSQGILKGIDQPKKALLITSVSTIDNAHPAASPMPNDAIPINCDSTTTRPQIFWRLTPTA